MDSPSRLIDELKRRIVFKVAAEGRPERPRRSRMEWEAGRDLTHGAVGDYTQQCNKDVR